MVGIVKGATYDKKSLYKQLGIGKETNPDEMSVSTLYQNSGYLFSQIEPQEIVVNEDSVDLVIKIFEEIKHVSTMLHLQETSELMIRLFVESCMFVRVSCTTVRC